MSAAGIRHTEALWLLGYSSRWDSQMLEVGQLEDLGWDGGQTIAVQTEDLQTAGQVGEAARLQRRDAVAVQEAGEQKKGSV